MNLVLVALAALGGFGAFTLEESPATVTVLEDGAPVMVYQALPGELPRLVAERYRRGCYIHPLYGLDGEVMTEDFPWDHRHHRGLFWAWPDSIVGGRKMDVWTLDDSRQVFVRWVEKSADAEKARLVAESHWVFDDAPDKPLVRETAEMVVHAKSGDTRAMDLVLTFENIGSETITIRGATTDNKGYGGLCYRPDSARKPMHFLAAKGPETEDILELASPWADVSFAVAPDADKQSGLAIFQHPSLPGYPHPGWIFRHYGFLGQSWPHTTPYDLAPGAAITLKYRVLLHRGTAAAAGVPALFDAYLKEQQGGNGK